MALPKGFKKKINIKGQKVGVERRQEILDDIDYKALYLPKSVLYEDMDRTFIEFVNKDLKLIVEGDDVPVIFLTLQRWSEFSNTWDSSDEYKNIKLPFITIVRRPNPQVGNNQGGLFNIPGRRNYTYRKVPTFEGGRKGMDLYKIPQPTSVDISYDVRLFSNKMRDLNKFNVKIQKKFNSIQYYLDVNGHPMPLILDSIGDESKISDFESRRYFIQPFEMTLEGYILDENDFEVQPAINRMIVSTEVYEDTVQPTMRIIQVEDNEPTNINLNVKFKIGSANSLTFTSDNNIIIDKLNHVLNVNAYEIYLNDGIVFSSVNNNIEVDKIRVKKNDRVTLRVLRKSSSDESLLSLNGNIYEIL